MTFTLKAVPADKLVFWHKEIIAVAEVIRKMGITGQTYYLWKNYGGVGS
ncbi:MAG: hypothetical protein ABSG75_09265 [Syntrophales bacterium]